MFLSKKIILKVGFGWLHLRLLMHQSEKIKNCKFLPNSIGSKALNTIFPSACHTMTYAEDKAK
jgi:hypothetical protein